MYVFTRNILVGWLLSDFFYTMQWGSNLIWLRIWWFLQSTILQKKSLFHIPIKIWQKNRKRSREIAVSKSEFKKTPEPIGNKYSRIFAFSFVFNFSLGCKYLISKYAVFTFNIFPFHSQQLKESLKLFLDTYVNNIELGWLLRKKSICMQEEVLWIYIV